VPVVFGRNKNVPPPGRAHVHSGGQAFSVVLGASRCGYRVGGEVCVYVVHVWCVVQVVKVCVVCGGAGKRL
jgi:hypothetical protein